MSTRHQHAPECHCNVAECPCCWLDALCRSVLCCAMLRCAVLRRAVLCCAAPCCAALRCAALCCAVLRCAALCCAVLCCAVLCCAVLLLCSSYTAREHHACIQLCTKIRHQSCHTKPKQPAGVAGLPAMVRLPASVELLWSLPWPTACIAAINLSSTARICLDGAVLAQWKADA